MTTCKDCIHYELCKYNAYQEVHYFGKDKEIYVSIDNNSACKFFEDATDVANIVYCKDCKHLYCCSAIDREFYCRHHLGLKGCLNPIEDSPYCWYGERMTD